MGAALITIRILVRSRVGVALQCIREDEETALAVGINIQRYKLLACMISAFFTSLGGVCSFYHMGHVGPGMFSIEVFDVIIVLWGVEHWLAMGSGVLSV
jgi:branched-chain amino acid transport system permease protein